LRDRLVECMGIGRDRKLKIKTEKIAALDEWKSIGPVTLFVFDQHKDVWYEATLEAWVDACHAHGKARTFENDGKAYLELDVKHFPSDPRPVPEAEDAA
jgi:hypothetical protein